MGQCSASSATLSETGLPTEMGYEDQGGHGMGQDPDQGYEQDYDLNPNYDS